MNIRTLEHFLCLADRLHFGRASEASHISISALSRHIRQLEQELGVSLFYRDNRTVSMTNEGKRFQQYAREAVAEWKVICYDLTDQSDELHGEISLYCSVTASYSILFDLLNRFRDNYPGIEIKLHTGDPEHAIERVLAGEEEISIAAHPGKLPGNMAFKPITVSPLLFIAPLEASDPALTSLPANNSTAWTDVPMILAEDGIARQRSDAWFRAMGVTPKIYAQVAGNEAIVSMVSLGLGVGVVPQIVLEHSPMADRIRILNTEPTLEPYHVGLFTLERHLKNPLVAAFWGVANKAPP